MLQKQITTKSDLIRLLQMSSVRKVIAQDVREMRDMMDLSKQVETMIRGKKPLTIFVVVS